MASKRYITEEDRKIRLDDYNLGHLRKKIIKDTTDLNERLEESINDLKEIVTGFYEKYAIDDNLKKYYPGCKRLNICITSCTICLSDIGFDIPKFKPDIDLLNANTVSKYINLTLTHPVISPTMRDTMYHSGSFEDMVFKRMSEEDKEMLFEYIGNYIRNLVNKASFLKEYRKPGKSYWRPLREFGVFTNLGQMYDKCPQYALMYKYDILGIKDQEIKQSDNKDEYINNLKKIKSFKALYFSSRHYNVYVDTARDPFTFS